MGDERTYHFSERIGLMGLYLFALFAYLGVAIAHIGLLLMLMAALMQWRVFGSALRRSPLPQLVLCVLGIVLISAVMAVASHPEQADAHRAGFGDVLQLWLFLLTAWWMGGQTSRTVTALTLTLIGFVLGTMKVMEWDDLQRLLAFNRPHFRWSINAFGQYAASGLLGIGLLSPRLWRWSAGRRGGLLARAAAVAFAGLMLSGVILSLSRGVWLSLLVVTTGLAVLAWRLRGGRRPRQLRRWALFGAVLLAFGLLLPGNPAAVRLNQIVEPFAQFLAANGDLSAVDDISFRERLGILSLGVDSWGQAPWIGLGPGAPGLILRANQARFVSGSTYTDFHALPLDLLVAFGILGTLALSALLVSVLVLAWRGYTAGCLPSDLFLTVVGLSVFNVLCQMTDTRIFSIHGRFFWILVAGAACSCWLRARVSVVRSM